MNGIKKSATLKVKDGRYACPNCQQRTYQEADPETEAKNLKLWCKHCKSGFYVNIAQGQCVTNRQYR